MLNTSKLTLLVHPYHEFIRNFLVTITLTTLTFRQILRIIGNDRLNEAFGLKSLQDFEESDEQISSYKIISMRDFLKDPNSIVV